MNAVKRIQTTWDTMEDLRANGQREARNGGIDACYTDRYDKLVEQNRKYKNEKKID